MRIIPCVQAIKQIFELLEGELQGIRKKQLDTHLKICRECCNRLEFEEFLKEKLHEANKKKKIPNSLEKRIDTLLRSF